MRDSTPAKGKAAPAARDAARGAGTTEVRVSARFYRRMKPQRVYPLVVELQGGSAPGAAPVFIQAIVPGAQVTPQELTLDPAAPGHKAVFYVTPLAKGKLPAARLDVFHQGRLVQEMKLSLRASTQCLTWLLAALTVLVPAALLYTTVFYPLTGSVPKSVLFPVGLDDGGAPVPEKLGTPPKEAKGPPTDSEDEENQEPQAGPDASQKGGDKPKKAGKSQGRGRTAPPDDAAPAGETVRTRTVFVPGDPGEILARRIINNVPDLPDGVKLPWSDEPLALTRPLAEGLGTVYTHAATMKDMHLSFWVGVGLLALTIGSAIIHRPSRGRVRSKPLVLGIS